MQQRATFLLNRNWVHRMEFERIGRDRASDLIQLFTSTFGASEGESEGALIGSLVAKLSAEIDDLEIWCFGAVENEELVGAIFFTRLQFEDGALIYMLAPVAVSTDHQKSGVGKALIRHGLNELVSKGALVAVTYGDPSYYEKVGFKSLSEAVLKAPLPLSMPHGWLGQSLTQEAIHVRAERPTCVEAFRDPAYW
jgi:predicted N-acetyltransferase YhbS